MVRKADQERVKTLLKDTITLLCKNGLTFKSKFSIEALIGVTLDDDDVFLVSINELIKSEKAHVKEPSTSSNRVHHPENDTNQRRANKTSNKEKQQREKDDREHQQRKRKLQEVKEEEESSEDDEYDAPECGEIRVPYGHKRPEDMWGEEDEDHPSTGYDDSSSQSFPPMPEPVLAKRENAQQMSPVKQARVQAQPRVPPRPSENTDIVFIKEEPDDEESWPLHEDEELDEGEIHPSMFPNMGSASNSGFSEDQNFHHISGMNLVPVSAQEESSMMSQAGVSLEQQQWQAQRQQYRSRRTATVTSDGQQQQQKQQKQPQLEQGDMQPPHTGEIPPGQDQDELEDNCFYAVCDYDDEYDDEMQEELDEEMRQEMEEEMRQEMQQEMPHEMQHKMPQDMQHEMHDLGSQQMPSPKSKGAPKKPRASGSLQTMYFCQICGRSFTSLSNYNTHKDEHKGLFKFQCEHCNKGYSTRGKLDTHMRHHTGERFLCTWCGKGFMSKTSLKRHGKSQHGASL